MNPFLNGLGDTTQVGSGETSDPEIVGNVSDSFGTLLTGTAAGDAGPVATSSTNWWVWLLVGAGLLLVVTGKK
jgi:hypothetical protein